MSIPINDISPYVQYSVTASTTDFDVPFPFFSNDDLKVYVRLASATPNDSADIVTTYTVYGAGDENGGSIVMNSAIAAGYIVTIVRDMAEDRLSTYGNQLAFNQDNLNDDFSKDVMMNQQNEMLNQTLTPHYQYNDSVTSADCWLEKLAAGESWRKSADGTKIEAFTASSATPANPTTASALQVTITQTAHGLTAGKVVYVDTAGDYVLALADDATTAEAVGIVTSVTDANTFVLQVGGVITAGLAGLTTGSVYYLSPTSAGDLTATRPSTPTQIIKPLLVATGAGSGIWINLIGVIV